jgi:ATP-dependent protease ClpP protease subunit
VAPANRFEIIEVGVLIETTRSLVRPRRNVGAELSAAQPSSYAAAGMIGTNAPAPLHYVIGFNLIIDRISTMRLLTAVGVALDKGAQSVTLCLSSAGGAPDQAFYAYEILRTLPVRLVTHNVGSVQSAALSLFLAGHTRLAVPHANFLMHKTVFNVAAGGSFGLDHLEGSAESLRVDDMRAMAIAAERTGKDIKEVRKWFARQTLRSADFARSNNLISDVRPLEFPQPGAFFQVAV